MLPCTYSGSHIKFTSKEHKHISLWICGYAELHANTIKCHLDWLSIHLLFENHYSCSNFLWVLNQSDIVQLKTLSLQMLALTSWCQHVTLWQPKIQHISKIMSQLHAESVFMFIIWVSFIYLLTLTWKFGFLYESLSSVNDKIWQEWP